MNSFASFPSGSRRGRYTAEQREGLLAQARRMRAEGMKMAAIVSELGVSGMTLAKWLKESRPVPAFVPIQVGPESVSSALTLVTPAGFRVEGLTPEALILLLRQLG